MKVTVVGSYPEEKVDSIGAGSKKGTSASASNDENDRDPITRRKFEEACRAIGAALAEDGHRLVVAHPENARSAEALALAEFKKKAPNRYYACIRHSGDAALKAHLDAVELSDVVVLIGGGNGTYASGLSALRRRKVMIPIPAFRGSAKDLLGITEIDQTVVDAIRNLDLGTENWKSTLTLEIRKVLRSFPSTLIIHGRGDNGLTLKARLQDASENSEALLGLANPVIMDLSGKGAVTVPQVFEELASKVSAAIVIVTADDIGGFARRGATEMKATELELEVRARENVWVEVGWFWGRLGRERIFLWLKDEVQLPSDLQGVARTYASTLDEAWKSITDFLATLRTSEEA
ncbi:MAG TPA: TIR domain-containing protein [Fimbriimonadaceae bacterium]|nr:TIR domain-containing protein [Fimbriimonadaceae bacterium]